MPYKEGAEDFEALGQQPHRVEQEAALQEKLQETEKRGLFRSTRVETVSLTDPQGFEVATEEREIKKDSERRTRKNTRGEVTGVTEFSLGQDGTVEEMRRLEHGTGRMTERVSRSGDSFFRYLYGDQGQERVSEHYDAKTGNLHSRTEKEYVLHKGKPAGVRSETETRYDGSGSIIRGLVSEEKTTHEYHDPECKVEKRRVSVKRGKDYNGQPEVITTESINDRKGLPKAWKYKVEGANPHSSKTVYLFEKGNKSSWKSETEIHLDGEGEVKRVVTDKKYDRHGSEISHTVLDPKENSRTEVAITYEDDGKKENQVRKTHDMFLSDSWKEKAKEREMQE